MSVPGYQEFMLPLLTLAADGREHRITDAIETLSVQMGIAAEDRAELLPSGVQTKLYNRVTWAFTYLTKSGLLNRIGRGKFTIAPRGLEILKTNPARIDNNFLEQFPEYREFKSKRASNAAETTIAEGSAAQIDVDGTPQEGCSTHIKNCETRWRMTCNSASALDRQSSLNTW